MSSRKSSRQKQPGTRRTRLADTTNERINSNVRESASAAARELIADRGQHRFNNSNHSHSQKKKSKPMFIEMKYQEHFAYYIPVENLTKIQVMCRYLD
ncbi:hypothetical protein QTP88_014757 [Uroleucon formosanum]